MKKNIKINLLFFTCFVLLFPIDICLLEDILQNENNESNLKYYIGGLIIIILISGFFYSGYGDSFEFFNKFEPEIEYRPPRNVFDLKPLRFPVYQIQQTIIK